jgi:hypothetical protein
MAIENIQTAAGTTFKVSASLPATVDAAGFGALTYTLVGEVTDAGEVGGSYGEATHTPLDSRLVQRLKTSFDAGTQTVQLAVSDSDAGQGILLTALHSDDNIAVEITLPDDTKIYYIGLVTSFPYNIGSVDTIVNTSVTMAINSKPLVV